MLHHIIFYYTVLSNLYYIILYSTILFYRLDLDFAAPCFPAPSTTTPSTSTKTAEHAPTPTAPGASRGAFPTEKTSLFALPSKRPPLSGRNRTQSRGRGWRPQCVGKGVTILVCCPVQCRWWRRWWRWYWPMHSCNKPLSANYSRIPRSQRRLGKMRN